MSSDADELLQQAKQLLEQENYAKLDTVISDTTLNQHQHPALYLYKCAARQHLDATPQEILQLAEQGLALDRNYISLIEFQFVNQMALNQYKDAVTSSSLLCQLSPGSCNYHFWHADALHQLGAHAAAQSSAATGHLQAAFMLVERGALDDALTETGKALQANADMPPAQLLRGKILHYQGDFNSAQDTLEALTANPDYQIDAWEILAKMAEYRNDIDLLAEFSRRILTKAPDHAYALRCAAKTARARGEILPLFDALDTVNDRYADDIWSHLVRLAHAGRLANDESFLAASYSIDVLIRLIEIFIETGMYEAAVNRLEHVPAEEPLFLPTVKKSAWKLWRYGESRLMNKMLNHAIKRHSPTAALYGLLAQSVADIQSMNEGLEIIEQGEQLDAHDLTLGFFKANIYANIWLNKSFQPFPAILHDELEQALSAWLEEHPHDIYALYYMAGVYYSRGDYTNAKHYAQQAYKDGLTTNVFFYYWWARILHANNDNEEALEIFEDKFEKRSYEHSRRIEHYLTKAKIVSCLGDSARLQETMEHMESHWPDRIDDDYHAMAKKWQQQVEVAVSE